MDKLDGKISEEFWQTKTKEWTIEKDSLYNKLYEAAQSFKTGSVQKKRRLIDLITSNSVYKDGNLDVELKPVYEVVLKNAKTGNWCAR